MTQFKQLDFTGFTIFCGVDVHKRNWRVNIQAIGTANTKWVKSLRVAAKHFINEHLSEQ